MIQEYLDGAYDNSEKDEQLTERKKKSLRTKREQQIALFLPPQDIKRSNEALTRGELLAFIDGYLQWCVERQQLLAQDSEELVDSVRLLSITADQARALQIILQDLRDDQPITDLQLRSWSATLYESVDIVQYEPEVGRWRSSLLLGSYYRLVGTRCGLASMERARPRHLTPICRIVRCVD